MDSLELGVRICAPETMWTEYMVVKMIRDDGVVAIAVSTIMAHDLSSWEWARTRKPVPELNVLRPGDTLMYRGCLYRGEACVVTATGDGFVVVTQTIIIHRLDTCLWKRVTAD